MAFLFFTCLAASSCVREEQRGKFIARVATTYLTEDELVTPLDSLSFTREFVNEWVSTELLYQEAARRGLVESDEIQRKLESVKKRMAIDALLNQELYSDTADISDEEIERYYSLHRTTFVLREDVALASLILFDDRDAANSFRTRVLRGMSWDDAVNFAQNNPLLKPHFRQVLNKHIFTQATLYPPELWKLVRTLRPETLSFVVSTDAGYYVLRVHDFRHQGEVADLPYVREEIRDRLVIEARRAKYDVLLQQLRSRFPVEVYLPEPATTGHESDEN